MKVIFLDFDGVISTYKSGWNLDSDKMNLVKKIVDETGAKIVISSSWRQNTLEDTLELVTRASGHYKGTPLLVSDVVIGITKRMFSRSYNGEARDMGVPRGVEIAEYLTEHSDITNYVILDDDSDMLLEQKDHFIQTDSYLG